MEKILIAINGKHGAWEALSHACSLAQRIKAQLNVLLITPSVRRGCCRLVTEEEIENQVRKRLMLHIEKAKSNGIEINCFYTEGNYVDEVISFTNNNKITLLISEQESGSPQPRKQRMAELSSLRHRIKCRIEVVAHKKTTIN